MVRLQGIAFPGSHRWSRCRVTLTYMRSSSPIRSRRGGSVPYGTDPMRIWGPHKNSWIRIQESGSRCIRIQSGMIRLHFTVLMSFFTDPDPRIGIRVHVTPNSFRKILNMIFLKENSDPRLPFDGSAHVLQFLALKKMQYPVWGLRRGSGSPRPPSLDGRIWVQYSNPDLPGLVRIIRASHSNDHDGGDTDPRSRIRVRVPAWEHRLFGLFADFYGLFRTLSDSIGTWEDMLGCAVWRGELLLKSGLKQEKLSVRPHYFLNCAQVFTQVEGVGSEAPIRRMACWGLQVILHGTSFIKINLNPRVCF